MRVLTVRQPWAWAIIHGGKDVENRSRNLAGSYRGPIAVHVAGKWADPPGLALDALNDAMAAWCDAAPEHTENDDPWFKNVGRIIGVVNLIDVHEPSPGEGAVGGDTCSPWAEPDVWHLVLANPRPLAEPIPFKGGLGLRRLDPDTLTRTEAQL